MFLAATARAVVAALAKTIMAATAEAKLTLRL